MITEEQRRFLHDFYQQYGLYPPEGINCWKWEESQTYQDYIDDLDLKGLDESDLYQFKKKVITS